MSAFHGVLNFAGYFLYISLEALHWLVKASMMNMTKYMTIDLLVTKRSSNLGDIFQSMSMGLESIYALSDGTG